MRHKGQAELIIILAILVLIGVVVAVQMGLIVTTNTDPDTRTAKEAVEGFIRSGMVSVIDSMGEKGGYLSEYDYQLGSVLLNGREVPYWQYGGTIRYPERDSSFRQALQEYLDENAPSFEAALAGLGLGTPAVNSVSFSQDKVIATVNLPTTYRNITVTQPYSVTLNTRFGEIFDFAKGFATYEASNRPLETFTISTMVLSPMENGHHTIPIYEILLGCGDYLFATSVDVMPQVNDAIVKTLARTYMPGKVPLNTLSTSGSPKYSLVPIGGKNYENLDVNFVLPDDFSLDYSNFEMSPDPVQGVADPIPMLGQCISPDPIHVSYSFRYPAIVRVTDPETNSIFQFAVQVRVEDNEPSSWSVSPPESLSFDACADPTCLTDVRVQDTSGNPLEGASVSFMGCHLGNADPDGNVITMAPCGAGTFRVVKKGYGEYMDYRNSGQLQGTATLARIPAINVVFHEVIVQENEANYMVLFGNVLPIEENKAYITFRPVDNPVEEYSFYAGDSSLSITNVPAGTYSIAATLASPDYNDVIGGLVYYYGIPEDNTELHVYIPSLLGLADISDQTELKRKISELSKVLYDCGIGPVTETPYIQEESCVVNKP